MISLPGRANTGEGMEADRVCLGAVRRGEWRGSEKVYYIAFCLASRAERAVIPSPDGPHL